ncbi:MAG: host attachment family protein [Sphingomonadaceae bacterium]|nr:host attachment family protein [Sphingomonadaceae bacterium]
MEIPHDAMVVVADGRKMLLFRNQGDEKFPKLEAVTHEEKIIPASGDQATDGPGTTFSGSAASGAVAGNPGANNRSSYEQTDFHQLEEDRFAAETAEMLRLRALRNEFSQLIVVAPPRALGELRKHYHKEVEARLIGEIAKDYANRPTDEIEKLIASTETKGSA